jgi:hypothetical protein
MCHSGDSKPAVTELQANGKGSPKEIPPADLNGRFKTLLPSTGTLMAGSRRRRRGRTLEKWQRRRWM